ncbi:PREDICTED: protein FAM171A1 [Nanorana parkeri]|uniref:protein FAM171A1 n=1 Tax=Nanorana parkeri TaxID=125878 RepID=UPI000853F712|nr:PREDICTED: protein FAM171A1 [Nanorana parkeri]
MISSAAALLLCVLGCNVWRALSKSLPEHNAAAQEVTLKVQVSDVSTHQPLGNAAIEIFSNQVSLVSGTTGADGTALIKLQYKLGNQLIVTATKHAYVPNSAPWRPLRLPVFSFVSLELLPERSATLMVYDDVVQIVSGYQGSRLQPQVHFARRALDLPGNATYKDLAAFLTAATTLSEVDSFPYLQGSDGNSSGNSSKFDLIPVTAISIHLLSSNKTDVLVQGPIYVTVPLPADSTLKHNEHVPAWRFDQNHGAWVKSSFGIIKQEGNQLTWTYIAPQMGYWVAAMSPSIPDPVVTPDIASYHTLFLLAILGGIAFILLVLFCLLIYYCRRKCIKPRQHHRKLHLSSALESSKKDQATSMSHINLISPIHMDMISSSGEADMHTPMLKPSYNTSRDFSSREELLSQEDDKNRMSFENLTPSGTLRQVYNKSLDQFLLKSRKSAEISDGFVSPMKDEYRRSYNSVICQPLCENKDQLSTNNVSAGSKPNLHEQSHPVPSAPETEQVMDRRPNECMMSRSVDHLERPTSFPRPGQLICFNSVDQVNDGVYRNVLPTLVIPAHYMKLQAEHPFVSQQLIVSAEQQYELERLQAELSNSHPQHPQPSSQLSSQAVSQQHLQDGEGVEWSGQNTVMSESVSIPASLNDATIAQLNGEVQLLTEKALMELGGGRPMPHPRAWFVSLDGRSNAHIRHSYVDLQRAGKNGSNDASLDSGVDMNEPKSGRKGRGDKFGVLQQQRQTLMEHQQKDQKVSESSAYTQLVYLDDMDQSGSECGTAVCSPEDNRAFTEPPKRSGSQLPSLQEETVKRTEDSSPVPLNSPDHEYSINDDCSDDQGENKKSPWQKREERPLLAFNMK